MKKLLYVLPIASVLVFTSCAGDTSNSEALDGTMAEPEEIDAAVVSFADGGATDGEEYFSGVLAEVVKVDVKLKEVKELDEMDATEEEITNVLDEAIQMMKDSRASLDLYKDENWPKKEELNDLTLEWFDVVEMLMNDYLYDLAEPMSRADDTWSQEDIDLYNEYAEAYNKFFDVDERWVAFQEVYAEANGFELSGATIDEDSMVQEEVATSEGGE